MNVKPVRRSTPLLVIVGLLLLGGGYLLGKGRLASDHALERAERREETRSTPVGQERNDGGRDREEAPHEGGRGGLKAGAVAPREEEQSNQGEKGIIRFEGEGLRLAHLQIEPAGYGSLRSRLAVTGTVEPNLGGVVKVTPRVAGKITSVNVNVGGTVRVGQPLATLTSTELAQAQAAYRQATARVMVAHADLARQKKLASLGAFSRPSLEAARAQQSQAQAEAHTARSDVAVAQAGVSEAKSQLRALQAALEQAQAQVKVTQSRFNRADFLLKEGLVSRQNWEQAQADYERARADVDAAHANIAQGQAKGETARANLQSAQAKLAAAEERSQVAAQALTREEAVYRGRYLTSKEMVAAQATLSQAQLDQRAAADNARLLGGVPGRGDVLAVKAPLGGRITERLVTLGETVTPDKTLFTIIDLNTVWVQFNIYPKDLPAVRVGQAVTVAADTAPGRAFTGTVSYISDLADPATRTVKVRAVIHNAGGALRPETFVRGTIAAGGRAKALLVPKEAVQQLEGKSVVFTPAGRPGEFRPHPVQIGEKLGELVEIHSGLKAGERIVTRNAFLVKAQALKGELGDEDEEKPKP